MRHSWVTFLCSQSMPKLCRSQPAATMTADADVLTSHDIFRGWAQGERWIAAGPADGVPSPSLWLGGRTGGVQVNQTEPGVVAAAQGDRSSSLLGAASSQDIVCNDARRKAKARSHECNYGLYLVAWDGIEPSTRGFSIEINAMNRCKSTHTH